MFRQGQGVVGAELQCLSRHWTTVQKDSYVYVMEVTMNQYDDNFYGRERFQEQYGAETIGSYTAKTFLWMFLGLMITFGVAIWGYMSMTTI